MTIELGSTPTFDFTVTDPATGGVVNADSTPTSAIYEDANDTAILTPTVTLRTSQTGHYRISPACTAANGFEVGKSYNVSATAVVGGVTAKGIIARFVITTAVPTALVVTDAGNTATTFKTDRTESTNDYWKDALLILATGSLVGQIKKISAYNGTTKFVTLSSALTAAPAANDVLVLINR